TMGAVRKAGVVVTMIAMLVATPARAEPQAVCSEAYVQGQRLQNRQKLVEAREHFTRCIEVCSGTFARECRDWLHELDKRIPTLVVRPEDPDGADVPSASVRIDDAVVPSGRDASPTPLDVGAHRLRIEGTGFVAIDRQITVEEGAAGRVLQGKIGRLHPEPPPKSLVPTPPPGPEHGRTRPIPWTVYALGGVALAATAAFTFFAIRGENTRSSLDDSHCAPRCAVPEVDRMRQSYSFADVS